MNENDADKPLVARKHHLRAKLIFNPIAGAARPSPVQIVDVIRAMQAWRLIPEAYLVEPDGDLPSVVRKALAEGFRLFVVCGGDGTISSVAHCLIGSGATLGIIPIGTQNNTALSLNIPDDVPAAIALLRTGKRIKVDMGVASCCNISTPFLEACSVGLASTLFPSVDDIQHGHLEKIGELLTTLASTPPSKIHLVLDNKKEMDAVGHVVLASNMPYIGFHYQLGSLDSFKDGLLDVLFFAELNKMELLRYVLQGVGEGKPKDPRIQHLLVRKVEIKADPSMPVLTDGNILGEGPVRLEVRRRALSVIAGPEAG